MVHAYYGLFWSQYVQYMNSFGPLMGTSGQSPFMLDPSVATTAAATAPRAQVNLDAWTQAMMASLQQQQAQQAAGQPNAPNPAAAHEAAAAAGGIPPPVQMNHAPDAGVAANVDARGGDFAHFINLLPSLFKTLVVLVVIYFHSSFARLLLILATSALIYFFRMRHFPRNEENIANRRRAAEDEELARMLAAARRNRLNREQQQAGNNADPNNNDDGAVHREDGPPMEAAATDAQPLAPLAQEEDIDDALAEVGNANAVTAASGLRFIWMFVTTLFTSLIPDPVAVD